MAGSGRAVLVDARSRMMSVGGDRCWKGLSFGSEFFLFFLGFIPEAFPLVANPCAGRRESNLKRGSYSSIFIDREAYLRPPVLFTQVTAIPSDSDGSPIMSSLSLIVSDVGHQGSFEGRFDYLLRRNGRQNPGPGRPQSPPRLHLVFSE